jgi:hypothetical protein
MMNIEQHSAWSVELPTTVPIDWPRFAAPTEAAGPDDEEVDELDDDEEDEMDEEEEGDTEAVGQTDVGRRDRPAERGGTRK